MPRESQLSPSSAPPLLHCIAGLLGNGVDTVGPEEGAVLGPALGEVDGDAVGPEEGDILGDFDGDADGEAMGEGIEASGAWSIMFIAASTSIKPSP